MADRWRIDPRVAWQIVGDEAVILDLGSGRAIGLNATGSFIWPLIETADEEEISRAVAEHFDVDAGTARRDVDEFLGFLRDRHLITPAAG